MIGTIEAIGRAEGQPNPIVVRIRGMRHAPVKREADVIADP